MKPRTLQRLLLATLAGTALVQSAQSSVIVVNTTDNTDFSAGKTNLYLAISLANTNGQSANTIRFAIPGAGPHYIVTPQYAGDSVAGGYPMITNHNLTIDGYSQAGAVANSNPILGSNNASLKIVIDSRSENYLLDPKVGATSMDYSLISGATFVSNQQGYGQGDASQIGIFRATNVVIRGLCFLVDWIPGFSGISVNSVSLANDPTNLVGGAYSGPFTSTSISPQVSLRVSGCWFNLMPDGQTVVDGGNNAVATRWHRFSGSNPTGRWTPGGNTVGVAKGSATPRAEFNIFMSYGQPVSLHGWTNRICGNFFNIFPDGNTQYMPVAQKYPGTPSATPIPTSAFIGGVRDGNAIIGVDGDGVNDSEERNIFGGMSRHSSVSQAAIDWQLGGFNLRVSGNYFGVGVDGVTRLTNSCTFLRISDRPTPATNCIVGSDFDGVSDALEGNFLCNNWPLEFWFDSPAFEPAINAQGCVDWTAFGAVPDVYNPDAQTGRMTVSWRGNRMVNNLPLYSPVYTAPNRTAPWNGIYNWTAVLFACDAGGVYAPQILGSMAQGSTGVGASTTITNRSDYGLVNATNYIPTLNPSSTRRLKGSFPAGFISSGALNRWTNYVMDIYIPNDEGLTNGLKFETLTNTMPTGWVQGEICVASNILVDAGDDLDAATSVFDVDISKYHLAPGTKLTCAISYSNKPLTNWATFTLNGVMTGKFALPVALAASSDISITKITYGGGNVTLNWTGGDPTYVIERSPDLSTGSWTRVTTTTSTTASFPAGGSREFYRVR